APKSATAVAAPSDPARFQKDVRTLVDKYCVSCHRAGAASADLALDGNALKSHQTLVGQRGIWEKVSSAVGQGHMPPPGMPAPTREQRDRLVGYVEAVLTQADCNLKDPGRVTMRRLNRAEYNNTVRDLLGVTLRPADDFPSDDVGYGFDNIGDVLTISPLLMEKYLVAAAKVAKAAVRAPEDALAPAIWEGAKLAGAGGSTASYGSDGRALLTNGEVGVTYDFPAPGKYLLRAFAWQQQAGPDPARMTVRLGGRDLLTFDIRARDPRSAQMVEVPVEIRPARSERFAVAFINDYFDDKSETKRLRGDRNLFIERLEIEGPVGVARDQIKLAAPTPSEAQRRLFAPGEGVADPKLRARKILTAFARRAYRRPPTATEVDRLLQVWGIAGKSGESFERGMQLAVQATLCSPHFLFRVEPETGKARDLNAFELASRLSYFLWSSAPDDELLRVAEQGKLGSPAVLKAQARRMLKDPRSRALTDNFAGQWLQLRKLERVTPDAKTFPAFDESLRAAMRQETELFFDSVVREDRSILEFLDSDWTFLNERLARHYGNTDVRGDGFRKVKLAGGRRGGVLTQASVLTLTSNPTRTSPVKRGKWVLDNLLNTPPPMPPPGVAELPDDKKEPLTGTLRQRLEQHRKDPACASCHQRMDPLGFGLENFDAVGAWRLKDGEHPVDPGGSLPDGRSFKGPGELRKTLLGMKGQFTKAMTEKLLTYALGRGVESTDRCNIDAMAAHVQKSDYRFSAVVETIVTSEPFRKQRGEKPAASPGGGAPSPPPVKKVVALAAPRAPEGRR
ncbi:MAG TPA: DUF1592 domain-containing protein, partial [Armatimonadaceae bacterium]|nr:DUF1592 domain-containing protein [Armatimonadaceae bacterium]